MGSFCSKLEGRMLLSILAALIFGAGFVMVVMAEMVPPSVSFDSTTIASSNYDNDGVFWVNWTDAQVEPIANYTVYIYNNTDGSLIISSNTTWKAYNFSGGVNNGNYTFNVSAVNTTGGSGPNGTSTWMFVDKQNATIILNNPVNNNLTSSPIVAFGFNATDNGAPTLNCSVNIDGVIRNWNASTLNNSPTDISVSGIAAGAHQWNISCTDLALNKNTSATRTLYADIDYPSVILSNPANGAWLDPGMNVTFNYTSSDDFGLKNCSLYITNGSNQNFAFNQWNSSALVNGSLINSFSLNLSTAPEELNYTWSVLCYDIVDRPKWASNQTLFIGNRSDLIISKIYLINSSNTLSPLNPLQGNNITFNVEVKNIGAVATPAGTNVSFYWDGGSVGSLSVLGNFQVPTNYTFNVSGVSAGPHTATANIDEQGSVPEANESNNELSRIILTGLNVTIINITPSKPVPGQQLLVNLSIMYQNGSPVAGIQWANISIADYYISGNKATGITNSSPFTAGAAGNYWFNITAPAREVPYHAEFGNHWLRIFVKENTTGQYYDNQWYMDSNLTVNSSIRYYEIQAPNLVTAFAASSYSLDLASASSGSFGIQIKNNGTSNISNISIAISSSNSALTIRKGTANYSSAVSCNYTAVLSPATNSTFASIDSCSSLSFNASATGTYTLTINAGGWNNGNSSDPYNATAATATVIVTRSNATSSSSDDDDDDEEGEESPAPPTYSYALDIIAYSTTTSIEQGSFAIKSFTVKNIGNATVNNVTFSMSLPSSLTWTNWYTTPSVIPKLSAGASTSVTTNISVPANAAIGIYTTTVKVGGKESGSTRSATFTLQVLPGAGERQTINASLANLSANITKLNETLLKLKDNANLTVAKNKLAKAAQLLSDAQGAMAAGDYLSAYYAQSEIDALLSEVRQILDSEKAAADAGGLITNQILIALGVIIAIAAFAYYSWFPEGYNSANGQFSFRGKDNSRLGRLKDALRGIMDSFRMKPKDAFERLSEKKVQSALLQNTANTQNYSFAPKADVKGKLKSLQTNLKEQFKEYRKENEKPVYNYQKKEKWAVSS